MCLATVDEFEFGALAAVGAFDQQHCGSLVRDGGRGGFVDEVAITKPFYRERRVDRVRLVAGYGESKHMRRAWRGFEPTGAPPAVHVQAGDGRLCNDG